VAGLVGLELANVILKKPLKWWANSHWITGHFGTRDFSRQSCQATGMQLPLGDADCLLEPLPHFLEIDFDRNFRHVRVHARGIPSRAAASAFPRKGPRSG